MQIEKNAIRLTRQEALGLVSRLTVMVATDMRLNDNDESGVYIAPPAVTLFDKELFTIAMHQS